MAYNACTVFVLPSIAELEGMVVLEAMACGKPIIISNSKENASRFFVADNGLLFETKDSKDLSNQILKIINDQETLDRMSIKSFEISKNFDINNSVIKLEQLYYSLLQITNIK